MHLWQKEVHRYDQWINTLIRVNLLRKDHAVFICVDIFFIILPRFPCIRKSISPKAVFPDTIYSLAEYSHLLYQRHCKINIALSWHTQFPCCIYNTNFTEQSLNNAAETFQLYKYDPKYDFFFLLNYIFNILRVLAHVYFHCVDESHGIEVICLYKQLFCIVQLFCCDCLF